jgi:hypothetical protein
MYIDHGAAAKDSRFLSGQGQISDALTIPITHQILAPTTIARARSRREAEHAQAARAICAYTRRAISDTFLIASSM